MPLVAFTDYGFHDIDLEAAAARGIPVCNVPDYCTHEVADQTLAMILALTRCIGQNAAKLRSGAWSLGVPVSQMRTLRGMAVGVVGYGRIGREVALRLAPFGCRLFITDPGVPAGKILDDGFEPVGLPELLAQSDLVTLHCPSTPQTRRMINAAALATMRRGSLLVDVSRGTLVDTDALVAALRSGALGGAALDVTDPEPIPAGHPLLSMENVLVTPPHGSGQRRGRPEGPHPGGGNGGRSPARREAAERRERGRRVNPGGPTANHGAARNGGEPWHRIPPRA